MLWSLRPLSRAKAGLAVSRRSLSKKSRFDTEAELHKIGENQFRSNPLSDAWSVGDAPNGGFLMYMALNAASQVCAPANHHDPLSFTAYYVNKGAENAPVDLTVRVVGQSRSSSTVHVSMSQEGIVRSEYMGTFGDLGKMRGIDHSTKTSPALPPPDECVDAASRLRQVAGDGLKLARQFELRLPQDDPCAQGLYRGKVGDVARFSGWVSHSDKRLPCLSSMAFFLDALPPPVMNLARTEWVPTLEYTVHFWHRPRRSDSVADAAMHHWLRTNYTTTHVSKGLLYTDAEVWSHDGEHLLATARQLARWLPPRKT